MTTKYIFACALIILVSCTNKEKNNSSSTNTSLSVIDIEWGMKNLTKLNISDFGKTIRYVPLETTDDCLIGKNPIVKVLKNYIVVETDTRCLLFDKKDGSFISAIGHPGQDPEAYRGNFSYVDDKEDYLYFSANPDKLVKYDMKGNFAGSIEFSKMPERESTILLTSSEIIRYYNEYNISSVYYLAFFDKKGGVIDTIPLSLAKKEGMNSGVLYGKNISGRSVYGNMIRINAIIIAYENEKKEIITPHNGITNLWNSNGVIRFKEDFIDTIFTISGRELIPSIIFNTGKWHWPVKEKKNMDFDRIYISDILENNTFLFFQCIRGLYIDEPELYNGLYNKKTGETKLSKNSEAIKDDLIDFMPFNPFEMSTSGEFVSFIDAFVIKEWAEKHPETKNNEKLSFLKDLNDDMNPVIVLVE